MAEQTRVRWSVASLILILSVRFLSAQIIIDSRGASRGASGLRPRYESLSPAELLQRVTAARSAFTPSPPTEPPPLPDSPPPQPQHEPDLRPSPTAKTGPRSYRKLYSQRGQQQAPQRQPNDATASLKELLKQSGPLSLSEVLQQQNLSLSELLQNKRLALAVLAKQASESSSPPPEVSTPSSPPEPSTTSTEKPPPVSYLGEHHAAPTSKRPPLFHPGQRYSKVPRPTVGARWPTAAPSREAPPRYTKQRQEPHREEPREEDEEPVEEERRKDSREDILDLLQPGSPVSLATLLSSRNMTLAELMDHRERGSSQRQLADLFSNILLTPLAEKSAEERSDISPLGAASSPNVIVARYPVSTEKSPAAPFSATASRPSSRLSTPQSVKPRGSRDPRLLDLPSRRLNPYQEAYVPSEDEEEKTTKPSEGSTARHEPELYDYSDEEEGEGLPVGVKSAIIASGGLLGLALVLFAAIFLCCRLEQRRRRGAARLPFLKNSRLAARSERSVIIKPAAAPHSKAHFIDF